MHKFKLIGKERVPLLNSTLFHYQHISGCSVYFMHNKEKHRAFNFCFRTPPENDKGIPHILEHSVLAGSEKFPVKDPFFAMLKSSPNTFMNAFTYDDRTMYLASSQVTKDFDNLFSVYLDAVFRPLLTYATFAREGYRLSVDEQGKAIHKGIVYNEMQAHYSDMDVVASQAAGSSVFSNSCYKFDAGGKPVEITKLKHQELVAYYKKYYHPSNACISFYGGVDIQKYLEQIEEYVSEAKKQTIGDNVVEHSRTSHKPVQTSYQWPTHLKGKEAELTLLTFLGPTIKSIDEDLDWQLLNLLLFENDHSPMRKALDSTKFATSRWSYSGISSGNHVYAMLGLHGVTLEEKDKFLELIKQTAEQVIRSGISQKQCDYFVKKLEIASRSHQEPVDITVKINSAWRFDLSPYEIFDVSSAIGRLKKRIATKEFFPKLINELFINNSHYNFAYLKPDKNFAETQTKLDLEELAKIKLTNAQKNNAIAVEAEIASNSIENIELPGIKPSDIRTKLPKTPQVIKKIGGTKIYFNKVNTKGLVYISVLFDVTKFSQHEYLPIYADLLGRVGINGWSAAETINKMEEELATKIASELIVKQDNNGTKAKAFLRLSGYCLPVDFNKLVEFLDGYINKPNFEETKLIDTVLNELQKEFVPSLTFNGYSTGIVTASRYLAAGGNLSHDFRGIGFGQTLQPLDTNKLLPKLSLLQKSLRQSLAAINISTDTRTKLDLGSCTKLAKVAPKNELIELKKTKHTNELWIMDTTIGFATRTYKIPSLKHKDSAALAVMSEIVSNNLLHSLIREQGGAYGGRCRAWPSSGILSFFTVRDPNLGKSYQAFDQAVDYLVNGKFDAAEIKNTICLLMGEIDSPEPPSKRAFERAMRHMMGINERVIPSYRSRVLKVTKKDIMRVAKKYLTKPVDVAICGKDQYKREQALLTNFVVKSIGN